MGGRVAPGGGAHLLDAHAELLALDAAVLLRRRDARLERAHRPLERVDLRVRRRDLLVLRAHQQRARRRQALLRFSKLGGGEAARLPLRLEFGGELALPVRPAVHFGLRLEQLRLQE